jgi:hypothetical protein
MNSKSAEQWGERVRNHWSVENKNHGRKDVTLLEDSTRSRKPHIICNLIMLRNLVLHYYEEQRESYEWLPHWIEHNQAHSRELVTLVLKTGRK